MKPELSIVLPCFNPSKDWLDIIKSETSFLREKGILFELIVVSDGTSKPLPKDSAKLLSDTGITNFISYKTNMGKGFALRKGVEVATAEITIYTDIDFPYTSESFLSVYNELKNNHAIVIGIRPASYYNSLPASRVFISKVLRACIRFFLRIPTDDTQCGLKGFNQKGKNIFLKTQINRYLFDMEFIALAAREKLYIKTCEVHLKPNILMPSMSLKVLFQEGLNFIRILYK